MTAVLIWRGARFTYTLKGNEIFFSRKEKSTVDLALQIAVEKGGNVSDPKK